MRQQEFPCRTVPLWLIGAVLLCAGMLHGQQSVEAGATIRVYTNLLQIPVLILSPKREPLPPIPPDKFRLHIDKDEVLSPRVRVEGEDPLTLAVLIDGSPVGPRLPQLSEALAAMARTELHPQDRITLFGTDGCKMRRTLGLGHADADTVLAAARVLQAIPPYQHHWHGEKCLSPVALWDALAWVSHSLQGEPGRRVVLVVTNGEDDGSKLSPDLTRLYATSDGVAVFALAERYKVRPDPQIRTRALGSSITSALGFITEGSGGMIIETAPKELGVSVLRIPQLLRGRYIVEFSRPAGMTAGTHNLTVSVGQPKFFIRNAGTSMPVADPVQADPTVQHGRLGDTPNIAAYASARPEQPNALSSTEDQVSASIPAAASANPAAPVPAQNLPEPVIPKAPADPTDITDEVQAAPSGPAH